MPVTLELQGKVGLRGVRLDVYLGWDGVERSVRQPVLFDVSLSYDLLDAARSDDLGLGVDYVEVYKVLKQLALEGSWRLLERMCFEAASEILARHPRISAVAISCEKTIMEGAEATFCSLTLTRDEWKEVGSLQRS